MRLFAGAVNTAFFFFYGSMRFAVHCSVTMLFFVALFDVTFGGALPHSVYMYGVHMPK